MAHQEARQSRVLALCLLDVVDHISNIGVEVLHVNSVTLTATMTNWRQGSRQLKHLHKSQELSTISQLRRAE